MLKKEVKRIEWGLPVEQPEQRDEVEYLLWIEEETPIDSGEKSIKSTPKVEPEIEPEDEEEEEEEVKETKKK